MNKGFFGKSPKFWIGQVPPFQTTNKTDPNRWGDRVKVRIMGYHPSEGTKLPDSQLPWAQILRPNSHGSLNRVSTGIVGGEFVFGFFLDDECTEPAILGVMPRTGADVDKPVNEATQEQSTGFKRIDPFHGTIQPSSHQLVAGEGSSSQQPVQLPTQDFFKTNPNN